MWIALYSAEHTKPLPAHLEKYLMAHHLKLSNSKDAVPPDGMPLAEIKEMLDVVRDESYPREVRVKFYELLKGAKEYAHRSKLALRQTGLFVDNVTFLKNVEIPPIEGLERELPRREEPEEFASSFPKPDDLSKVSGDKEKARTFRVSVLEFLERRNPIPETVAFRAREGEPLRPSSSGSTIHIVSRYTLDDAVVAMAEGKKIAAVSFASCIKPGGGVLNGQNAQEEALARAYVDWYLSLCMYYGKTQGLPSDFSAHLYKDYIGTKNQTVLVTPDVQCRGTRGVVIISAALPNLSERAREDDPEFKDLDLGSSKSDLRDLTERDLHNPRIKKYYDHVYHTLKNILEAAEESRCPILNVGAIGSGVFANNPRFVAAVWKKLLTEEGYANDFEKVIFAIPTGGPNFDAYSEVLAPSTAPTHHHPSPEEPLPTRPIPTGLHKYLDASVSFLDLKPDGASLDELKEMLEVVKDKDYHLDDQRKFHHLLKKSQEFAMTKDPGKGHGRYSEKIRFLQSMKIPDIS